MSDLISREDAKNALANLGIDIEDYWEDAIDGLPPVEPERKPGKWIRGKDGYIRCDKCGSRGSAIKAHYCHHCGAKMEGGKQDGRHS